MASWAVVVGLSLVPRSLMSYWGRVRPYVARCCVVCHAEYFRCFSGIQRVCSCSRSSVPELLACDGPTSVHFGLQPVVECVALFPSLLFVNLVRPLSHHVLARGVDVKFPAAPRGCWIRVFQAFSDAVLLWRSIAAAGGLNQPCLLGVSARPFTCSALF
jgi:hypothetical protein